MGYSVDTLAGHDTFVIEGGDFKGYILGFQADSLNMYIEGGTFHNTIQGSFNQDLFYISGGTFFQGINSNGGGDLASLNGNIQSSSFMDFDTIFIQPNATLSIANKDFFDTMYLQANYIVNNNGAVVLRTDFNTGQSDILNLVYSPLAGTPLIKINPVAPPNPALPTLRITVVEESPDYPGLIGDKVRAGNYIYNLQAGRYEDTWDLVLIDKIAIEQSFINSHNQTRLQTISTVSNTMSQMSLLKRLPNKYPPVKEKQKPRNRTTNKRFKFVYKPKNISYPKKYSNSLKRKTIIQLEKERILNKEKKLSQHPKYKEIKPIDNRFFNKSYLVRLEPFVPVNAEENTDQEETFEYIEDNPELNENDVNENNNLFDTTLDDIDLKKFKKHGQNSVYGSIRQTENSQFASRTTSNTVNYNIELIQFRTEYGDLSFGGDFTPYSKAETTFTDTNKYKYMNTTSSQILTGYLVWDFFPELNKTKIHETALDKFGVSLILASFTGNYASELKNKTINLTENWENNFFGASTNLSFSVPLNLKNSYLEYCRLVPEIGGIWYAERPHIIDLKDQSQLYVSSQESKILRFGFGVDFAFSATPWLKTSLAYSQTEEINPKENFTIYNYALTPFSTQSANQKKMQLNLETSPYSNLGIQTSAAMLMGREKGWELEARFGLRF